MRSSITALNASIRNTRGETHSVAPYSVDCGHATVGQFIVTPLKLSRSKSVPPARSPLHLLRTNQVAGWRGNGRGPPLRSRGLCSFHRRSPRRGYPDNCSPLNRMVRRFVRLSIRRTIVGKSNDDWSVASASWSKKGSISADSERRGMCVGDNVGTRGPGGRRVAPVAVAVGQERFCSPFQNRVRWCAELSMTPIKLNFKLLLRDQ